ncbi:MAG: NAD(P)-binding protein [Bryobacteraceae bacterium]|jgi:Pyruvate/2-oxoacid:ferredoxin oxidoreductase delta subunit
MMTGLFKPVKKPVIRRLSSPGGDIGPQRPQYAVKTAPCTAACPSVGDIRGWLTAVADAEANARSPEQALRSAWEKIAARNPFPAVCGRVCPADCESACPRETKDGAVAIRAFERYVGDFALERGLTPAAPATPRGEVAAAGAGPAGLSFAYQLARRGWRVTVFDAAAPGGFLCSLPGLPAEILDREIARITALGVTLRPEPAPGDAAFTDPGGTLEKLPHVIAEGRLAAEALDAAARGTAPDKRDAAPRAVADRIKTSWYVETPRHEEILNEADAVAEARRCFACGACMGCGNCWMYCANGCFERTPKGNRFKLNVELCHGCSRCAEECPSGYIDMQ